MACTAISLLCSYYSILHNAVNCIKPLVNPLPFSHPFIAPFISCCLSRMCWLLSFPHVRTYNQSLLTYTCSDSNTHLTDTATHLQQILLSSIFIHGIFDCAGHGVRGLSYTAGYSPYFFYACPGVVAAFILFWSMLISKYTKVRYLSHCTHYFTSHSSSLTDAFTMHTLLLFLSFILPVCLPISFLVPSWRWCLCFAPE